MKIAIIGSVGHYNYALEGIKDRDDITVAGIAPGGEDENVFMLQDRLCDMGYKPHFNEDYRVMLDEVQPDIAVVNPFFFRNADISVDVLKRNIHLFIEKPVSTTLEGLENVESAYSRCRVNLCAMFGIRYDAAFLTAKKLIDDGAVGNIRIMDARKSYRLGKRADLYKLRSTYGGTIPWVGSHAVDWLRWLSKEEYTKVYASHSIMDNDDNGDLELTAMCHFNMTNDVIASASIDYLRPGMAPTHGDDRIRIAGTKGVLEVREGRIYLVDHIIPGEREIELLPEGNIFADFLNEIEGKGKCMVTAKDSFTVTRVCLKARYSADTGNAVEL